MYGLREVEVLKGGLLGLQKRVYGLKGKDWGVKGAVHDASNFCGSGVLDQKQ